MKFISTVLLTISLFAAKANTLDSLKIEGTHLLYHKVNSNKKTKAGLIIYMHGGVSQFKGQDEPIRLETPDLLEGNEQFLPEVNSKGFDVILPISYNQYNWLEAGGEQFVHQLIEQYGSQYQQIIIAGFSDGGTAAYRYLYNTPEKYSGAIIFNGYPQLDKHSETIDHTKAIGKKIIYASTKSDKLIPYEFLLVEHRRQQILNRETYFMLRDGSHSFKDYKKEDIALCMDLLLIKLESQPEVPDGMMYIYPPIDGLVVDGEVKELYPFRKKSSKNYSMNASEYPRLDYDYKAYTKLLSKGKVITTEPWIIESTKLKTDKSLNFDISIDGTRKKTPLTNWLLLKTWNW